LNSSSNAIARNNHNYVINQLQFANDFTIQVVLQYNVGLPSVPGVGTTAAFSNNAAH
jgi:hypothetical protein